MGEAGVLFASATLRATLHRAAGADGARPLVISFDSLSHDLSLDRRGFGQGWLETMGYDAVYVVSGRNDFYQAAELPDLLSALRTQARTHPFAVTYGSSMGGYAAVRFAGRVGARRAVALSPQFSIDSRRAPFERRWRDLAAPIRFRWEELAPGDADYERAYVVYDPLDADRLQAEALAASFPVVAVPLPHAGHASGALLLETGLLSSAVSAMIAGELDAPALARSAHAARRSSAIVHVALADRQPPWRPRTAAALSRRAVELRPEMPAYHNGHARRLTALGRLEEAEASYRRSTSLAPDDPNLALHFAAFLAWRRAQRPTVDLLRVLSGQPSVLPGQHLRAVELLVALGAYAQARDHARQAWRTWPESRHLNAVLLGLEAGLRTPGAGRGVLVLLRRRWLKRADRRYAPSGSTSKRATPRCEVGHAADVR